MKKIKLTDMLRLANIEPDGCIIIRVLPGPKKDNIGFQIHGRLSRSDGKTVFTKYVDRITGWDKFFSCASRTQDIWSYITSTEPDAEVAEIVPVNAIYDFVDHAKTKNPKFYAISTVEFNEILPLLSDGTYMFFIEQRKN